jgi:hypothetical protein
VERPTTELTGRLTEYTRLAEQMTAMRDNVDEIREVIADLQAGQNFSF